MYRPDIVSVFRRTARRHGGRPFLIDDHSSVTYAAADRLSDAAAVDLAERGVAPGDTVGFCAPDKVSLWLGILGAWKAGALPGLLDAQLSAEALPYFVEDVNAPVVAAALERHDVLRAAGARSVIDLDELVHRTPTTPSPSPPRLPTPPPPPTTAPTRRCI